MIRTMNSVQGGTRSFLDTLLRKIPFGPDISNFPAYSPPHSIQFTPLSFVDAVPDLLLDFYTIPDLPFSAQRTLQPAVDEFCEVQRSFLWFLFTFGFFLMLYAMVPMIFYISEPWLPDIIVKNRLLKTFTRGGKALLKRRVHTPLLIGLAMFLLAITLSVLVSQVRGEVERPLLRADVEIASFINVFNGFNAEIVLRIREHLDIATDAVNEEIEASHRRMCGHFRTASENVVGRFQSFINAPLGKLGVNPISFPHVDTCPPLPYDLFPSIPFLTGNQIRIPEDLLSLKATVMPIVDRVLDIPRTVVTVLWVGGLCISIIPLATVIAYTISPWVPKRITEALKENKSRKNEEKAL